MYGGGGRCREYEGCSLRLSFLSTVPWVDCCFSTVGFLHLLCCGALYPSHIGEVVEGDDYHREELNCVPVKGERQIPCVVKLLTEYTKR